MRRKRFQRGSVKPRKRNGKNYWYAQWREDGLPKSKELGLVSKMTRIEAEQALAEILEPVNQGAGRPSPRVSTFAEFILLIYLLVFREKWKASTAMTEENRIMVHLVGSLGRRPMRDITREELQKLLNQKSKKLRAASITFAFGFAQCSSLHSAKASWIGTRNDALYAESLQGGPRKARALAGTDGADG